MKIALVGYGRMGRAVEAQAEARGHEIVACLGREQLDASPEEIAPRLAEADVAIDFTVASLVPTVIRAAALAGTDLVVGTTGSKTTLTRPWPKPTGSGSCTGRTSRSACTCSSVWRSRRRGSSTRSAVTIRTCTRRTTGTSAITRAERRGASPTSWSKGSTTRSAGRPEPPRARRPRNALRHEHPRRRDSRNAHGGLRRGARPSRADARGAGTGRVRRRCGACRRMDRGEREVCSCSPK
jgi:hypothetical protein